MLRRRLWSFFYMSSWLQQPTPIFICQRIPSTRIQCDVSRQDGRTIQVHTNAIKLFMASKCSSSGNLLNECWEWLAWQQRPQSLYTYSLYPSNAFIAFCCRNSIVARCRMQPEFQMTSLGAALNDCMQRFALQLSDWLITVILDGQNE